MPDPSTFFYDEHAALDLMTLSERVQDGAVIQDITYSSPAGGRASAYLIFTQGEQPAKAGLLFGHWGEGNRDEFVEEAIVLAQLGFASLCLDAPFRRPAEYEPQLAEPPAAERQWLLDMRRGVDLLLQRFELSPGSIGYVGHSFGATYGGTLAGIEQRISAYVLMAGWYALSELMQTSTHPLIERDRANTPAEEFQAYLVAMAPLDASQYIGHAAPAHLFFQFARDDDFVSIADAQRFFDLASSPKQIAWYEYCNHELNAQARLDRVAFLCEWLGMPLPSQELNQLLQQVTSPVPLEGWEEGEEA